MHDEQVVAAGMHADRGGGGGSPDRSVSRRPGQRRRKGIKLIWEKLF